jgi:flagellar assembly factor FliW
MSLVRIVSSRFGRITLDDSMIVTFDEGVIGFPDHRRYVMLKQRPDSVFLWLQSADAPRLALPIVLPWVFYWDYAISLSDDDLAALGVERAADVSIYCVINASAGVRDATINLLSPIVVHNKHRCGRQVINALDGYSARDRLFRDPNGPTPVAMRDHDTTNVTVIASAR